MNELYEKCKSDVARKHGVGKTLVIGHLPKYYEEAAMLYAEQVKSVDLADVGNWKPDETLELLSEIFEKIKLANEEVENGIYDPMLECAKHIYNNYKIVRR